MSYSIIDCLAVSTELRLCCDEITHFTLRQADGFTTVALQERSLSHRFGLGFRARLEKLSSLAECAKVDVESVGLAVLVLVNFEGWASHAEIRPISDRNVQLRVNKPIIGSRRLCINSFN